MKMKRKVKSKVKIFLIILAVAILFVSISHGTCMLNAKYAGRQDYSNDYELVSLDGGFIFITDELNVRSEPLATIYTLTEYKKNAVEAYIEHKDARTCLTYTIASETRPMYLEVEHILYPINCNWDEFSRDGGDYYNGPYFGLFVSEIKDNKNWKSYFRFSSFLDFDEDGIVWIADNEAFHIMEEK